MFYWVFEAGVEERPGWTSLGDPLTLRRTLRFRSYRGGSRWHAACDLVVPVGTPILSVCDGTVIDRHHFYEGTWQITVLHQHSGYEPFVVRYGEVLAPERGGALPDAGSSVVGGTEIAQVGQLSRGGHMLHFELYASANRRPSLSIARNLNHPPETYTEVQRQEIVDRGWDPDFQRRADLANPSEFLLALKAGERPPAPVSYRTAAPADSTITFSEDEVETIVGERMPASEGVEGGSGGYECRRGHLPSAWSAYSGLPDDIGDDVSRLDWRRHGPEF